VPREVWRKAGAAGLLCCDIPTEYGGAGGDFGHCAVVTEELARANLSGPGFVVHSDMVATYITRFGTEAQKEMIAFLESEPGRKAVKTLVPKLREQLGLDFVVVNGENAAAGFGITAKICAELHNAGVDCITTGNHVWDQREIVPYIAQDKRLLRPVNFPPGTPGWGANLFQTARGQKVVVINVMCRLFMDALDDPFRGVDVELAKYSLGGAYDLLARLGYSCLSPRPLHEKSDRETIADFQARAPFLSSR